MRRWIRIQRINTHNLIIRPRREISPVWRESNRMNRSRVVAHRRQLLRFAGAFCTRGVIDGLCRPDADVTIYQKTNNHQHECPPFHLPTGGPRDGHKLTTSSGYQTTPIRRDITAVNLEVLPFTWISKLVSYCSSRNSLAMYMPIHTLHPTKHHHNSNST